MVNYPTMKTFTSAKTRYGRRLGNIFDRVAWSVIIVALVWGHYRCTDRMLAVSRAEITALNARAVGQAITSGLKSERRYFFGMVAICIVFYSLKTAGRRKLEELGDDMEGLTTKVLHDQSRAFGDINIEATDIMSGDSEPLGHAQAIEAISSRERKKISAYMLLARNFDGYDSSSLDEVNLSDAAWRVIADNKVQTSGIELKCSTPAEDVVVTAHRPLVFELLGNLVENAVKYTDAGTVSLEVYKSGNSATIVVSDTGRGISNEDRKHIFERFYRSPSASDKSGNGLGLATVREIAEGRYHGKVSCDSTLGRGTTFTVTLPLRQPGLHLWRRLLPASARGNLNRRRNQ